MSHASDESGSVPEGPDAPDDRLSVRPYAAAPSAGPSRSTVPDWPRSGPAAVPGRACAATQTAVPVAGARARRGRSRRPLLVLGALALAAACGLAWLLNTPDPEPGRTAAAPALPVPMLHQRNPGAGEPEAAPEAGASTGAAASAGAPSASRPVSGAPGSPPPPSPSTTRTPKARTSGTLRRGDTGPEVRALQERLYGQGFTYVSVTGVYDDQTWRGVTQLQRDRGIKGDPQGVYGPATRAAFEG
ncbi:peptidoglycan-binding domain-containing protein [Streptomyces sp. NPDC006326]|uniref:peptidoglycan-binding domain-containing protein n=1 Tax=Streptomyces sp. NPDC006326 TaxID=3156752 RepID=UPI0033BEE25D